MNYYSKMKYKTFEKKRTKKLTKIKYKNSIKLMASSKTKVEKNIDKINKNKGK